MTGNESGEEQLTIDFHFLWFNWFINYFKKMVTGSPMYDGTNRDTLLLACPFPGPTITNNASNWPFCPFRFVLGFFLHLKKKLQLKKKKKKRSYEKNTVPIASFALFFLIFMIFM